MIVILFLILSFICWSSSAFCNSVMDTITHHWWNCKFHSPKYNEAFWNPDSKKKPYIIPHTKYKVNAWHLFKSAMIVLQALSACFIFLVGVQLDVNTNKWILVLDFIVLLTVYGILWNSVFNPFYNKILINKK